MPRRGGAAQDATAASITRGASLQSYLTIRWLADRQYRADAFALYAYFRWLDDMVDERLDGREQRLDLVARQRALLDPARTAELAPQEALLVGLVGRHDGDDPADPDDGLLLSLRSMLDVMELDACRRGRTVSQAELDCYTGSLAVAVTEALHHCIGHGRGAPRGADRYVAVRGAHVAHMLRDLVEDVDAGYLNLPAELAGDGHPTLDELHEPDVRAWVRDRVGLARSCFAAGRRSFAQVESGRCRLAGHAYIARFEWVLDAIEHDAFRLRPAYPERATLRGGVRIAVDGARSALAGSPPQRPATRQAAGA